MAAFRCEYCGEALSAQDRTCPQCGAANPHHLPEDGVSPAGSGNRPRTVEELQAFCASRGMPLEKMRFFIGEDYRQPRAFGIYRDGPVFVVYKNKADGSRAIRYRGPDEAYAVGELYDKLMAEHEKRANLRMTRYAPPGGTRGGSGGNGGAGGILRSLFRSVRVPLILFAVMLLAGFLLNRFSHRNDGYYRVGEELFYRYGTSWFMDSVADSWYEVADFPYENYETYYAGRDYETSWGGSSFTDSQAWTDIQNSDSDSGDSWDYSGWDSGDTDWDSDW